MKMSRLDACVERIYSDTLQKIRPEIAEMLKNSMDAERGYALMDDAMLDRMVTPDHEDLRINAHVYAFDDHRFPHRHTFYELTYVHRGGCRMDIQNSTIELSAGDFILMNPAVIHDIGLASPDARVINILIKNALLNGAFMRTLIDDGSTSDLMLPSLSRRDRAKNYIVYRKPDKARRDLKQYLERLLSEYIEDNNLSDAALEINLAGMLMELTRVYRQQTDTGAQALTFSLSDVMHYMDANLSGATLCGTADRFGYNPRYFSSMLKKACGKSFVGLLAEMRVNRAAKLLRQTDLPVRDILHVVGYENSSHFYKLFIGMYGESPASYRLSGEMKGS